MTHFRRKGLQKGKGSIGGTETTSAVGHGSLDCGRRPNIFKRAQYFSEKGKQLGEGKAVISPRLDR